MDPLTVLLIVVISVLTVLLVIVFIQISLILKEVLHTLKKVNATVDSVEKVATTISAPLSNIGGMAEGVTSGLKIADTVIDWAKHHHQDEQKSTK